MAGFEDFLGGILRRHVHPEAQSDNPADYPRSCPIRDPDILADILALEHEGKEVQAMVRRAEEIMEEVEIKNNTLAALKGKIFLRLKRLHPEVSVPDQCGTGWRRFGEQTYFVSWGPDKRPSDE